MSERILLVGAGGHARACVDVIESAGQFTVYGLLGMPSEVGTRLFDYSVLATDAELPALRSEAKYALVTVGQIKTPEPRMRLFDLLVHHGYELPAVVSPHAHVSPRAVLGAGTIVMHGAVVNAGATVGQNCIINSNALVEHDAIVGDHCHVATSAVVNGGVRVGSGTLIGSGSVLRQCITIGDRCLIGMGQRVLGDCDAGTRLPSVREPT